MKIVGLTGGIGMGKSTAAAAFRRAGVPVFDADATVHALQARHGRAVPLIARAFPGTVEHGVLNRGRLRQIVLADRAELRRLEQILHPLVRAAQRRFLAQARGRGKSLAVLDIPLLFETGGEKRVDAVVVVSAPPEVQRQRVLQRPGMAPEKLDAILARQMADADKRARADFVIDTSRGLDPARAQVEAVVASLRERAKRGN